MVFGEWFVMKKAFVTGAGGFIGRNLVNKLISEGYEVIGLAFNEKEKMVIQELGAKAILGNVVDVSSFNDYVLEGYNFFHLAAVLRGEGIKAKEVMETNTKALKDILNLCVNKKVKKFVFLSSTCIYGPKLKIKKKDGEFVIPEPQTPYEKSKVEAEKIIKFYQNKIPIIIVRADSVYGPWMNKKSGAYKLFQLAKKKVTFIVHKKNSKYNFTYVKNLVDGMIFSLEKVNLNYFEVNIVDKPKYNFKSVLKVIIKEMKVSPIIIQIPVPIAKVLAFLGDQILNLTNKNLVYTSRTLETLISSVDLTDEKLTQLGFNPKYSLEEGVKETVESFHNSYKRKS
jgi:GlcNAc-P-P-Und epimerase